MTRFISIPASRFCLRVGSLLCLLGYVGVATPLLPLGAASLAWLDGGHSVSLVTYTGGVAVVLGHEPASSIPQRVHSHGTLATALVLMAAATPGQADHILGFRSGGTALVPEETFSLDGNQVERSPVAVLPFAHITTGPPPHDCFPESPFLPLPNSVRVAQTTVLLI